MPLPTRRATPCQTFATTVGTINAASASSGDMNDPMAEIMIIGIAKPTAPLTKPPTTVTSTATPMKNGSIPPKICSKNPTSRPVDQVLRHSWRLGIGKSAATFSVHGWRLLRILIALHLQRPYSRPDQK